MFFFSAHGVSPENSDPPITWLSAGKMFFFSLLMVFHLKILIHQLIGFLLKNVVFFFWGGGDKYFLQNNRLLFAFSFLLTFP